jgi:hypothetical protein
MNNEELIREQIIRQEYSNENNTKLTYCVWFCNIAFLLILLYANYVDNPNNTIFNSELAFQLTCLIIFMCLSVINMFYILKIDENCPVNLALRFGYEGISLILYLSMYAYLAITTKDFDKTDNLQRNRSFILYLLTIKIALFVLTGMCKCTQRT